MDCRSLPGPIRGSIPSFSVGIWPSSHMDDKEAHLPKVDMVLPKVRPSPSFCFLSLYSKIIFQSTLLNNLTDRRISGTLASHSTQVSEPQAHWETVSQKLRWKRLDRWLSNWEHWLLFLWTQVLFPAPTQWLTIICKSSPRTSEWIRHTCGM